MSRVGKKPIAVPKDVKIGINQGMISVEGPKGKLSYEIPLNINVETKEGNVWVKRSADTKPQRALHGLVRMLIFNMIKGVTEGYSKELEIIGVGFKAQLQGDNLKLQLGFSHDVLFPVPEGIKIETAKPTQLAIRGIDKQKVGDTAARIRSIYPPEPYKGKGIRYVGEYVRKKLGKAVTK
jgi:large subunit ribosomal protein L6